MKARSLRDTEWNHPTNGSSWNTQHRHLQHQLPFYQKTSPQHSHLQETTRSISFPKINSIADGTCYEATPRQSVPSSSVLMGNTLLLLVSLFAFMRELMVAADKLIKLWDSRTGEFIQNFEGHTKGISDIAWSSNSTLLASGSDDKTVRLWDVNTVISYLPHLLTSRENASRR